jgi:hypothetical protein
MAHRDAVAEVARAAGVTAGAAIDASSSRIAMSLGKSLFMSAFFATFVRREMVPLRPLQFSHHVS